MAPSEAPIASAEETSAAVAAAVRASAFFTKSSQLVQISGLASEVGSAPPWVS